MNVRRTRLSALALAALLALGGCGGSRAAPVEERPARWTSGDDAPLEGGADPAEARGE